MQVTPARASIKHKIIQVSKLSCLVENNMIIIAILSRLSLVLSLYKVVCIKENHKLKIWFIIAENSEIKILKTRYDLWMLARATQPSDVVGLYAV